jgi:DNA-binding response OmpR family regulator
LGETYDLIVLDVMLPGIDGFDVCRWVRAGRMTSPVLMLMLTALGAVDDRVKGLNVGAGPRQSTPVRCYRSPISN